jgi:hypothetical protein
MASFRLPGDVVAALRKLGNQTGESMSDLLRRGALVVLGICPTCGREANLMTEPATVAPGRKDGA